MSSSPSSLVSVATLVALVGSAYAEQRAAHTTSGELPRPRYIRTPGAAKPRTEGPSQVSSRIVYLHRCPLISGCQLTRGSISDSRTDASTIVEGSVGTMRTLGEFKQGNEIWAKTLECVKKTFAPFNITVTDQNPGNVPHFENMVGGKGTDINAEISSSTIGLAPFDCGEIPNGISFTFDVVGPDFTRLCWTASQEIAHMWGLEHEFLQGDPMTYLDGPLEKRFRDVAAPPGEFALGEPGYSCSQHRDGTQNSYRDIVALFGPGAPTPPEVAFQRPVDGKQIQPGYRAVVDAIDDVRTEKVEFFVDGQSVGMTMTELAGSFELVLPDLGAGDHMIEARATDVQGVVGSQTIAITQGPPCTADKGCSGTEVCAGGVCVPGMDEGGGLGDACQADTECQSHRCVDGGEALKRCVESCDVNASASCPSEFSCVPAGPTGGVCYYTPEGGCCDSGRSAHGSLVLGFVVALALRTRRRRRG